MLSCSPFYLSLALLLDEGGFFADLAGSLTPNAPLLINLLFFKYSSIHLSTLPLPSFISPTFKSSTHTNSFYLYHCNDPKK